MQIPHFFAILDRKRVNDLLKKADSYQCYDRNGTKLSSTYKIALLTEKNWKGKAIKAQQILKTVDYNLLSATFGILEVAEVAICTSNCAFPTFEYYYIF